LEDKVEPLENFATIDPPPVYTFSALRYHGQENPSRVLTDQESARFHVRLKDLRGFGKKFDSLAFPASGGYAVSWAEGPYSFHLVCRKGVVAIFDDSGTPSFYADTTDIGSFLFDCDLWP